MVTWITVALLVMPSLAHAGNDGSNSEHGSVNYRQNAQTHHCQQFLESPRVQSVLNTSQPWLQFDRLEFLLRSLNISYSASGAPWSKNRQIAILPNNLKTEIIVQHTDGKPRPGTIDDILVIADGSSSLEEAVELVLSRKMPSVVISPAALIDVLSIQENGHTITIASDSRSPVCFLAGTQVTTPSGTQNIEDLKVGAQILAFNLITRTMVPRRVTHVLTNQAPNHITLTLSNNTTIRVTDSHPFYLPLEIMYKAAEELVVGDILLHANNEIIQDITIVNISRVNHPATVHNIEVEGKEHNYYANGILVHNKKHW